MTDVDTETIEIEIDPGRAVHYEALVDEFGEEFVDAQLAEVLKKRLTQLYDERDAVRQQLAEQQR